MKTLWKRKPIVLGGAIFAVILCVAIAVIAFVFNRTKIDDPDTPLGSEFRVTLPREDSTTPIQQALNSAAEASAKSNVNAVVTFEPGVYYVSGTILIPDKVTIMGNGATLVITSDRPLADDPTKAFKPAGTGATYREFAIMSSGMVNGGTTTFAMHDLNLELVNNVPGSGIPTTIFGVGKVSGVEITNCNISVSSSAGISHSVFDAYTAWDNLVITGCTFNIETDAKEGGVWLRNFNGKTVSGNALIRNCTFNKRAGDEILCIWGSTTGAVSGVTITECTFNQFYSASNNPPHFIRFGNTGITENIVFENNIVNMDGVVNSVFNTTATQGKSDNIVIRDNIITVNNIYETSGRIVLGDSVEKSVLLEGNTFHVNSGESGLRKYGVSGRHTQVIGNTFTGDGLSYVTYDVKYVYNNTIQICDTGFYGVTECVGNTIEECRGNFIMLTGANCTGTAASPQTITISGNTFISSNLAVVTSSSSAELNCHIDFIGNEMYGGRIVLTNKTATNIISDNTLRLKSLDNISTSGKTIAFENNRLLNLSGESFISGTVAPSSINFNNSIPVGTIFYNTAGIAATIEPYSGSRSLFSESEAFSSSRSASVESTSIGTIIGFEKIAKGTGNATWSAIKVTEENLSSLEFLKVPEDLDLTDAETDEKKMDNIEDDETIDSDGADEVTMESAVGGTLDINVADSADNGTGGADVADEAVPAE